ncbi:MAG: dTDP-4-dehydrorhamnose 3,5-epimerase family protein [Magnetococcales bacterium]|nr:dTDP-4-dehydrorhamnose 3,5-epimerase family protein [Magnetococcales bacterium]
MEVCPTKLDGVLLIKLDVFEDFRGQFVETYNEALYRQSGIDVHFKQDDISVSSRHVLRGIHGDSENWKLISCHYGQFYMIVINNDRDSAQYRQWQSFVLSDRNRHQVLIPPKFGNGYLVMSDLAIFNYKQSSYYNPQGQFTLRWNDPELGLWWPVKEPIVSRRDEVGHFVN